MLITNTELLSDKEAAAVRSAVKPGKTRDAGGAAGGRHGKVMLETRPAQLKWARTVLPTARVAELKDQGLLDKDLLAAQLGVAAVQQLCNFGERNVVCVTGRGTGQRLAAVALAVRYAVLGHDMERVGVMLGGTGAVAVAEDENVWCVECDAKGAEKLRREDVQLVVVDSRSSLATVLEVWPDAPVVCFVEQLEEDELQWGGDEPDEEVADKKSAAESATDKKRARPEGEEGEEQGQLEEEEQTRAAVVVAVAAEEGQGEEQEEEENEKRRRVEQEEDEEQFVDIGMAAGSAAGESGAAAVAAGEEGGEEMEVDILGGAGVAASYEEDSQEGTAREGVDLALDYEMSEKSFTEAVERPPRLVPAAAAPAAPRRPAAQEFVAPSSSSGGNKSNEPEDEIDMEEINQLIGEELASI